ncbi:glycosyltransferase family A protein [Mangrovihabitans endophyticus]|uniref:Glycosyltransferase 2-like domain-containing protein n=1 Tax=Mangrovihabitans endophyticus TaxID=1751298 RepID=A0A8J3BXU7_9ACTN|nr:glycosyltransferase family A protein [Mangrovihabitans endophyticus]GGK89618.1 hypothetical protein GCM10012284_24460 [Mangrovihabitans endophyticus]
MGHARELLDDHLAVIGPELIRTLPPTAVRTRSLFARDLLAHAGLGGAGTLADLLAAARGGDRRWLSRLRRRADARTLAALAQTIAHQDLLPGDRQDALALYGLIRSALGSWAMRGGQQGLHAQFAYVWQGPDRARELVSAYPLMRGWIRAALKVDLANPFAGGSGGNWPTAFARLLPEPRPVLRDDDTVPPFDRLTATVDAEVTEPHRISVVVTAFRPGEPLLTAVRSILAQTWTNVEVVIVDDASPPEHDEVLNRAVALGRRVRVVRMPVNGGTYAARNAGLDAAEGEFVTFQDSDDWSHPRRLELQVRPLLADSRRIASTSDGLSVTDNLVLTRPNVRSSRLNPSSLLFRRDAVVRRIGYFDRVRKGGDSEYIGRIATAFGPAAVVHVESRPLALIRLSEGSLSRSEIKSFWMHPARAAYASGYLGWHRRIADGEAEPRVDRSGGARPFAAPSHLTGAEPGDRRYDVVVAADWRYLHGAQRAALDEIHALRERGMRVAVMQMEALRTVTRRRAPLAAPVQRLVDDGLDLVFAGEPAEVGVLIVRHPEALQFASGEPCEIRPRRVLVVADRAPARVDGSDRRYLPEDCTEAVRRRFGVDPIWCPQDPAVREALRPSADLTPYDLPTVVRTGGYVAPYVPQPVPIVGTDLCDAGVWPADLPEALRVLRRRDDWDVRLRLPDRPEPPHRLPVEWMAFRPDEVGAREFLHQLDFFVHFPSSQTVEVCARAALEAAACGRVVVLPERFAAVLGDAAVYCAPGEVAALVRRYHGDADQWAEQSRRARQVIAHAYHGDPLAERIAALVRPGVPPAQRSMAATSTGP